MINGGILLTVNSYRHALISLDTAIYEKLYYCVYAFYGPALYEHAIMKSWSISCIVRVFMTCGINLLGVKRIIALNHGKCCQSADVVGDISNGGADGARRRDASATTIVSRYDLVTMGDGRRRYAWFV